MAEERKEHPFDLAGIDAKKLGWEISRVAKECHDISVALFELIKVNKELIEIMKNTLERKRY